MSNGDAAQVSGRRELPALVCDWVTPAILPCWFLVYSRIAIRARGSWAGFCDGLAFIVLLGLLVAVLAKLPQRWLRVVTLQALTAFFIVFFVGNAAYYRFFDDWVHYQILNEWRLAASIAGGTLRSLTWWDWGMGIVGPLILTAFIAARRSSIRLGVAVPMGLVVLVLCAAGHTALRARSFVEDDHIVFMHFLRGTISRYTTPYLEADRIARVLASMEDYYPTEEGYRAGTLSSVPLLRVPGLEGDAEPLFEIDKRRPPNIVLVLMESVRAMESGVCGAKPSFTPNLDRLAAEGITFRNFYSNGAGTVRGEFALLCSFYPHFGGGPVYINWPSLRISSLPCILRSRGYETAWISSYDADYSNKAQFLLRHGVDRLWDRSDLPCSASASLIGWGPSDEVLFKHATDVLDDLKQPFFAEIMTLSNHWDYQWDYPTASETPVVGGDETYAGYTRGIYYTDWAIGRFMEQMRKKPYFGNTIFVFCGDHGIWTFPTDRDLKPFQRTEAYFRNFLILYAPELLPAKVDDTLGSQVDFAPTMLQLLGIRQRNSFVGRSLLKTDGGRQRSVLLLHTHRWNLRIGNRCLYDLGPEYFPDHFPRPPAGYRPDPKDNHALLISDQDLLTIADPGAINFGSDEEKERLIQWTEDLLFMNSYLTERDMIYDQRCPPRSQEPVANAAGAEEK